MSAVRYSSPKRGDVFPLDSSNFVVEAVSASLLSCYSTTSATRLIPVAAWAMAAKRGKVERPSEDAS